MAFGKTVRKSCPVSSIDFGGLTVDVNTPCRPSPLGPSSHVLRRSCSLPAFNTAKCEKLQKEKEDLERRFEEELRRLGWQQQAELQELQERLQGQFEMEMARLQEEHHSQLLRIRCQHQEQVSRPAGTGSAVGQLR